MNRPGRVKVQCFLCGKEFNLDHKKSHEKSKHNGEYVLVRTLDAPENPFIAAAKRNRPNDNSSNVNMGYCGNSKHNENDVTLGSDMPVNDTDSEWILTPQRSLTDPVSKPSDINKTNENNVVSSEDLLENVANNENINTSQSGPSNLVIISEARVTDNTSPLNELRNIVSESSEFIEMADEQPVDENLVKENSKTFDSSSLWIQFLADMEFLIEKFVDTKKAFLDIDQGDTNAYKLATLEMIEHLAIIKKSTESALNTGQELLEFFENQKFSVIESVSSHENEVIPHYPGLRPRASSSAQKQYLIELGAHQPKLKQFPLDSKKRRFSSTWYEEFAFLEYSIIKDVAFCFTCSLFLSIKNHKDRENAWVVDGVKNWSKMKKSSGDKKGKLLAHFSSDDHKKSVNEYNNFRIKKRHIDVLIDPLRRQSLIEAEKIKLHNKEVIKILVDICKTLGRQGLAFRGEWNPNEKEEEGNFQQIVHLIARHNLTLRNWIKNKNFRPYKTTYFSPLSQNELISLIAAKVRKTIVEKLSESYFFSVMADTTSDASHKDMMSVVVRFTDNNLEPHEYMIKLDLLLRNRFMGF